tara:strand:+ start:1046 stop:2176 length:1131 start_codon:yes stop_codon:yes gene_type:complete
MEVDGYTCLVDPWFEGRVFNESWSLLEETNIDEVDLDNLKYIFYTHEHPDHLNWKTLNLIKKKCKNDLVVVLLERKNKNIVQAIKKMKINVAEVQPNKLTTISKNLSIVQFPTEHDSAQVFKIYDKVILNQNDCYLSDAQAKSIKSMFPTIDYWFMQFSLAGFYANEGDTVGLRQAKDFHVGVFDNYKKLFNPKITIPFASFVYFCKEKNKFLNNNIVKPLDIEEAYKEDSVYFLKPGDTEQECVENGRKSRVLYWQSLFDMPKKIYPHKFTSVEKIEKAFKKFINENESMGPLLGRVELYIIDHEKSILLDHEEKKISVCSGQDNIGKLYSEDLHAFYAFPWGADTLNISSCFEVIDAARWSRFLSVKDGMYERF